MSCDFRFNNLWLVLFPLIWVFYFLCKYHFLFMPFWLIPNFFRNTTRPWCLDALNSLSENALTESWINSVKYMQHTHTHCPPYSVYSMPDFKHSFQHTCYTWRHFVNNFPKIIYRFKYYHPIALNVCDSYQTQVNTVRLVFVVGTKIPIWEYTVS